MSQKKTTVPSHGQGALWLSYVSPAPVLASHRHADHSSKASGRQQGQQDHTSWTSRPAERPWAWAPARLTERAWACIALQCVHTVGLTGVRRFAERMQGPSNGTPLGVGPCPSDGTPNSCEACEACPCEACEACSCEACSCEACEASQACPRRAL